MMGADLREPVSPMGVLYAPEFISSKRSLISELVELTMDMRRGCSSGNWPLSLREPWLRCEGEVELPICSTVG